MNDPPFLWCLSGIDPKRSIELRRSNRMLAVARGLTAMAWAIKWRQIGKGQ